MDGKPTEPSKRPRRGRARRVDRPALRRSRRRKPGRPPPPPPERSLLHRLACYTWASPTTLLGLIAGAMALGTGGGGQLRQGAIEFHGGFAAWFGDRIGFEAMTLGHVILGRTAGGLDELRIHEQAHVRQAERWGPFFLPAYLAASFLAWWRGGHYYRDNSFERDARRAAGEPD